jgi:hypothetical protein
MSFGFTKKPYLVTATKIINYNTIIYAETQREAEIMAEEKPIEEYDNNGGEFTIDFVEPTQTNPPI